MSFLDRIFAHDRKVVASLVKIVTDSVGNSWPGTISLLHGDDVGVRMFDKRDGLVDAFFDPGMPSTVPDVPAHDFQLVDRFGKARKFGVWKPLPIDFKNLFVGQLTVGCRCTFD